MEQGERVQMQGRIAKRRAAKAGEDASHVTEELAQKKGKVGRAHAGVVDKGLSCAKAFAFVCSMALGSLPQIALWQQGMLAMHMLFLYTFA